MRDSRDIVVWFGAGISMPSGVPPTGALTWGWLSHLLPPSEVALIRGLFESHEAALGKAAPRFEKVVEDAAFVFGEPVLSLLDFFGDVQPNADHREIARHLVRGRGFAVTTNFDRAVELASETPLPVHTPSTSGGDAWGLIKLHGCIDEPRGVLGHSIRNLVRGISHSLRDRLLPLLAAPDLTHVFVGTSGSDFFDVVPFFRRVAPVGASAVWVDHAPTPGALETVGADSLPPGARAMLDAFAVVEVWRGDTTLALSRLLRPEEPRVWGGPTSWSLPWAAEGNARSASAWVYAAKLHASLGCGLRSLAACRAALAQGWTRDHLFDDMVANALRDAGCYEAELELRRRMPEPLAARQVVRRQRHLAAALRLARRPSRAAIAYRRLFLQARLATPEDAAHAEELAWSLAEAGLFVRDFIVRLPRALQRTWAADLLMRPLRVTMAEAGRLLPRTRLDPHLVATLQRLEEVASTTGRGAPEGFYRDVLAGRAPVPVPLEASWDAQTARIYAETDSILGRVNALREDARTLERVARVAAGRAAEVAVREAATHAMEESLRLAHVIDDVPGAMKASVWLAQRHRMDGRPTEAKRCVIQARRLRDVRRDRDARLCTMVRSGTLLDQDVAIPREMSPEE